MTANCPLVLQKSAMVADVVAVMMTGADEIGLKRVGFRGRDEGLNVAKGRHEVIIVGGVDEEIHAVAA